MRDRVALLRPVYLPPDPVSRTSYVAGEIAQYDFWFPDSVARLPGMSKVLRPAFSATRASVVSPTGEQRLLRRSAGPNRPAGLSRALYQLPILLYRVHLGWLLGGRFMLIEHTGRRSGRTRRTVVEVVEHFPADGSYVVASGFGPEADWYRNLLAHPNATIQVGQHRQQIRATPVTAAEGGRVMVRYADRHRIAARRLCDFMGYQVDGSETHYRVVGEHLPFLRLTPQGSPT